MHISKETCIRHVHGNTKKEMEMSPKNMKEIQAGDIHLVIIILQMVFKSMILDRITA